MGFLPAQLIRAKRDGARLGGDDIRGFLGGVTDGSIPDYQIAAMLMAIFFRGLDDEELAAWSDAMVRSGDVLDLSAIPRPKVDKHSTGGVGDKISIPLAPAAAAAGLAVPMVSGRGLGHTGGTLDKLESIPGFRVDLSTERFIQLVGELGVALIGQTERVAPADRRLYALRDVTATIESIPLIASSIMSKKLAEGIDGLVLDCKVGRGAFMKTLEGARALCKAIRAIGVAAGKRVTCVLTAMDAPIGRTIGNALEIAESIEVLRGGGPADTRDLTVTLGGEMLVLGGIADTIDDGMARIAETLDNGRALDLFRRLVAAQGGDPRAIDDPTRLPTAGATTPRRARRAGFVAGIDSEAMGIAALLLGAGRRTKEDRIDPAAGIVMEIGVGDPVTADQTLCTCHHDPALPADRLAEAARMIDQAIELGDAAPAPTAGRSRVLEVMR